MADALDIYPLPLKCARKVACKDFIDEIDAEYRHKLLNDALKNLRPREEFVIRRKWFNGFTFNEVGKLMDLSKGTVAVIERKALRKLRHPKISSAEIRNSHPPHYYHREIPPDELYAENLRMQREKQANQKRIEKEKLAQELRWQGAKLEDEVIEILPLSRNPILRKIKNKALMQFIYKSYVNDGSLNCHLMRALVKCGPPPYVFLSYRSDGFPYLDCDPKYGTISRNKYPLLYDEWLKYFLMIEQVKKRRQTVYVLSF